MKVNNIGVNAYRQLIEQPQINRKETESVQKKQTEKPGKINIPVQSDKVGSDLGVRVNGQEFLDMLTDQEKEAFEMVFDKFNSASGGKGGQNGLGRFVDVKL